MTSDWIQSGGEEEEEEDKGETEIIKSIENKVASMTLYDKENIACCQIQ